MREENGMRERLAGFWLFSLTNNGRLCVCFSTKSEREPFVCLSWWKMRVRRRETSAWADVDWQVGAAGMCLAAALCGTGTNRSIIARESNRYGQIITWSEGTKSVPNMHTALENVFVVVGSTTVRERWRERHFIIREKACIILTGWRFFKMGLVWWEVGGWLRSVWSLRSVLVRCVVAWHRSRGCGKVVGL